MTSQVHIDKELLEHRLSTLINLYDEVHDAASKVDAVAGHQTPDVWSDAPGAVDFAIAYQDSLNKLSLTLAQVRDRIHAMYDALKSSAQALEETDGQIHKLLTQITNRLDSDVPPTTPTGPFTPPVPTSDTTPTWFPTGGSTPAAPTSASAPPATTTPTTTPPPPTAPTTPSAPGTPAPKSAPSPTKSDFS